MSGPARLILAAFTAYVFIGLLYAAWGTIEIELQRTSTSDLPAAWSSPMAFVVWFLVPAALWPWNLVGLFYLAASRRSAPRRLKSTYPDHH